MVIIETDSITKRIVFLRKYLFDKDFKISPKLAPPHTSLIVNY